MQTSREAPHSWQEQRGGQHAAAKQPATDRRRHSWTGEWRGPGGDLSFYSVGDGRVLSREATWSEFHHSNSCADSRDQGWLGED